MNNIIEIEKIEDDILNDEEFEKHKKLPIYKKSLVIRKLTKAVTDMIDENKDELNIKQLMLENAYMISSKIAGAEAGELYSYRLENALSIKRYANELLAESVLCETKKIGDQNYLPALKQKIEELRKLFIDWVDSFDKEKDVEDPWKLWQDYGGE
jgi:vacuolar-type H+-ATPase subunit I/STV1